MMTSTHGLVQMNHLIHVNEWLSHENKILNNRLEVAETMIRRKDDEIQALKEQVDALCRRRTSPHNEDTIPTMMTSTRRSVITNSLMSEQPKGREGIAVIPTWHPSLSLVSSNDDHESDRTNNNNNSNSNKVSHEDTAIAKKVPLTESMEQPSTGSGGTECLDQKHSILSVVSSNSSSSGILTRRPTPLPSTPMQSPSLVSTTSTDNEEQPMTMMTTMMTTNLKINRPTDHSHSLVPSSRINIPSVAAVAATAVATATTLEGISLSDASSSSSSSSSPSWLEPQSRKRRNRIRISLGEDQPRYVIHQSNNQTKPIEVNQPTSSSSWMWDTNATQNKNEKDQEENDDKLDTDKQQQQQQPLPKLQHSQLHQCR